MHLNWNYPLSKLFFRTKDLRLYLNIKSVMGTFRFKGGFHHGKTSLHGWRNTFFKVRSQENIKMSVPMVGRQQYFKLNVNCQQYHHLKRDNFDHTDAVSQRCSVKNLLLEITQNSQENICARVCFFDINTGLRTATLLKKRLWHRCFPVNFAKFLRTPFLTKLLR